MSESGKDYQISQDRAGVGNNVTLSKQLKHLMEKSNGNSDGTTKRVS